MAGKAISAAMKIKIPDRSGNQEEPELEYQQMISAGKKLRDLREQIGLTLKDVVSASMALADIHGLEEFIINPSRLSDIETKGVLPSIHRLYSLSVIYRTDFTELMGYYGVNLGSAASDYSIAAPRKTHRIGIAAGQGTATVPVKLDPGFDPRRTGDLARMVQEWGTLPIQFLDDLSKKKYSYAYIGTEDYTMYPLLLPGSFVQVDEDLRILREGRWASEFERPIYLVETRTEYCCCWCSLRGRELTLLSHPQSPVPPRTLRYPQEGDIVGQVVSVAMRLSARYAPEVPQLEPSPEASEGEPKVVVRPR